MYKRCNCGHYMDLTLRTVVHARSVHIHRVPVYTCTCCERSELLSFVKKDIAELIRNRMSLIAANPHVTQHGPLVVAFDEVHELSSVLAECVEVESCDDMLPVFERRVDERVNQLLDLYLIAKTCNDALWMSDLQRRLKQVTGFSLQPYRVKIS
ncbi:hypothetical protein [Paenibacillus apiarius]|uniref:YgiT-type zinc finger protein n=1 Tax=Paenibacillus apiarius TaxID=46240 RepID=A0ABT4DN78_9BACL|nr:hypothetical protein [Paenibacillus apiarius]MCY9513654.1 hypothetical protein [Paenibacillus apiarius]MCY9518205.1 hypothetical protein [Paenibacillus apiarius]MCY9551394.1 hypothetical protein [Paenibacillus apiarius]MCY9558548.1 hypothetical protein [Paenibacillus apiarius]MCY9684138.1 hypothetical protein [Paenibacillus apiarius]